MLFKTQYQYLNIIVALLPSLLFIEFILDFTQTPFVFIIWHCAEFVAGLILVISGFKHINYFKLYSDHLEICNVIPTIVSSYDLHDIKTLWFSHHKWTASPYSVKIELHQGKTKTHEFKVYKVSQIADLISRLQALNVDVKYASNEWD